MDVKQQMALTALRVALRRISVNLEELFTKLCDDEQFSDKCALALKRLLEESK